tara:strand:+ start:37 stop:588 length:552 start_codon:yes stop_codon:yes gene_type:complete
MKLIKTSIEGLIILKSTIVNDNRGYFLESYNKKNINSLLGNINFVQENESMSFKGVLRGLHFQKPPFAQAKLVKCLQGEILDVAVDLRKTSKTFCKHETCLLSQQNKKQIFIPKGFAHGFLVLSDFAVVSYKVDNYYNPKYESGILWNDRSLNINWNIDKDKLILSEKDKNLNLLTDIIHSLK